MSTEAQNQISRAQMRELERRIAIQEANPKRGSSWEEVKARLQNTAKLQKPTANESGEISNDDSNN